MNRREFAAALAAGLLPRRSGAQTASVSFPKFADITKTAQIDYRTWSDHTSQKYLIESMVGGVALFDYDGDGWLDIFFVNGAELLDPMPEGRMPGKSKPKYWNRLYRNNRDGTFSDVTVKAGVRGEFYGMGVAIGDYDNDGRPDIYVTNYGRNTLYRNNGDGTFTDVTEKAGVGAGGWSASACWVDYDKDGKLDLIVSRYLVWDIHDNPECGDKIAKVRAYCHPEVFPPAEHIVYHNNGDGTFTDVTSKVGWKGKPGNGLGIGFDDFDLDGWPDILVANDARPQQFFRNNRNGTFSDIALEAGIAYDGDGKTYSGMGVAIGDYDNDSWPDAFIGNLANQRYAIYKNVDGTFEYVSNTTGVGTITQMHSGWGTAFLDFDNDGWKDLFVAQSHVMDNIEVTQPALRYLEPLLMMRNVDGRFIDVSKECGAPFTVPMSSRGVAFGDIDNDGFVDIVINCNEGPAVVLRNLGNANHWLAIDARGTVSNRDGIGARIKLVTAAGRKQYAMATTAGSYQSSSDRRVHFGMGSETRAALVEITWPSGIVQRLENVAADQFLKITEPARQP
jgi:hypothetical protein